MKLKRYWIYLGIGIFFLLMGILATINGSEIISSLFFGVLFLSKSYSNYRFSIKKKSNIGRDLTIFTFSSFFVLIILGDFLYSIKFLIVSIFFSISWYFEDKNNQHIK